jgi:type VI protein secretion system component VasF
MKPDLDDNQLRQFFRDLKEDDGRAAPRFAPLWQAATARANRERRQPTWWRLASATAMLIVAGIGVASLIHGPAAHSVRSAVAPPATLITQWKSPTDFLLGTASGADSAPSPAQSNQ